MGNNWEINKKSYTRTKLHNMSLNNMLRARNLKTNEKPHRDPALDSSQVILAVFSRKGGSVDTAIRWAKEDLNYSRSRRDDERYSNGWHSRGRYRAVWPIVDVTGMKLRLRSVHLFSLSSRPSLPASTTPCAFRSKVKRFIDIEAQARRNQSLIWILSQ